MYHGYFLIECKQIELSWKKYMLPVIGSMDCDRFYRFALGKLDHIHNITCGVAQGSVLGPTLYNAIQIKCIIILPVSSERLGRDSPGGRREAGGRARAIGGPSGDLPQRQMGNGV